MPSCYTVLDNYSYCIIINRSICIIIYIYIINRLGKINKWTSNIPRWNSYWTNVFSENFLIIVPRYGLLLIGILLYLLSSSITKFSLSPRRLFQKKIGRLQKFLCWRMLLKTIIIRTKFITDFPQKYRHLLTTVTLSTIGHHGIKAWRCRRRPPLGSFHRPH